MDLDNIIQHGDYSETTDGFLDFYIDLMDVFDNGTILDDDATKVLNIINHFLKVSDLKFETFLSRNKANSLNSFIFTYLTTSPNFLGFLVAHQKEWQTYFFIHPIETFESLCNYNNFFSLNALPILNHLLNLICENNLPEDQYKEIYEIVFEFLSKIFFDFVEFYEQEEQSTKDFLRIYFNVVSLMPEVGLENTVFVTQYSCTLLEKTCSLTEIEFLLNKNLISPEYASYFESKIIDLNLEKQSKSNLIKKL